MEKKAGRQVNVRIISPSGSSAIMKSDKQEHMSKEEGYNSSEWLSPPMNLYGLRELVKESTILPQCIRAYKNNIAGFGLRVKLSLIHI